MRSKQLETRTKQFALRVIRMFVALPKDTVAQVIGKQLLRSATSVAANYREASRARSRAELKSKLGQVEQELDESMLWFELLMESEVVSQTKLGPLYTEAEELLKIVVTSIKTLKTSVPPKSKS